MKLGDIVELKIRDIGANGEGIAEYGGKTVFIPFALTGETVLAQVEHIKKRLAYANIIKIIESSYDRVIPICPLFQQCGGCDYLHLKYSQQLTNKKKSLATILYKNAGYQGEIQDIVESDQYYYRNKIQLPFGYINDKIVLGFYKSSTHEIIPLDKCYLHAEWADKLIDIILQFSNKNKLSVYSEETKKGLLRHLVARYIDNNLSVTLVINGKAVPNISSLVADLQSMFDKVSVSLSPNTKPNNVIMGNDIIQITAPQPLNYMGIDTAINPLSFFQVNDKIATNIYTDIINFINPDKDTVFIDAYSGIGLIGAVMAKSGAKVYNIDIVPAAIDDANNLYANNNLSNNVINICGNASVELPKLFNKLFPTSFNNTNNSKIGQPKLADKIPDNNNNDKIAIDIIRHNITRVRSNIPPIDSTKCRVYIFLDPPRKGLDQEIIPAIGKLSLTHEFSLIYLSCNPATLSRDISLFQSHNFRPTLIKPYDMFPNTKHVECVVLMSRVEK